MHLCLHGFVFAGANMQPFWEDDLDSVLADVQLGKDCDLRPLYLPWHSMSS